MHNHVISLTTANARRQHITQEFAKHNIPFEFFDAITVSELKEVLSDRNISSYKESK